MTDVMVQKVADPDRTPVPVFDKVRQLFEDVQEKAFNLFEKRGRQPGRALEDWLKAEHEILGDWPAAEFIDTEKGYELRLTLPGFEAKEIEVTAVPGEIVVHAKTQHAGKGKKAHIVWSEFGSNEVYRRFELPDPIDVNTTFANLDKGILHITAAKVPLKTQALTAATS